MATDFLEDWEKGGHTKAHLVEGKAAHTQGPWEKYNGGVTAILNNRYYQNARVYVSVPSENTDFSALSIEEIDANNTLIAAAPDLLAASKLGLENLLAESGDIETEDSIFIRAAIAKAEGK